MLAIHSLRAFAAPEAAPGMRCSRRCALSWETCMRSEYTGPCLSLVQPKLRASAAQLALSQDVLAVTGEGTGGLFVNPSGYVHDVVAIRHMDAGKVMLLGSPSQEHSWFPGYAWTIANCSACGSHLVGPPHHPRTAFMTGCLFPPHKVAYINCIHCATFWSL